MATVMKIGVFFLVVFAVFIIREHFPNLAVTGNVFVTGQEIQFYICLFSFNMTVMVAGYVKGLPKDQEPEESGLNSPDL